MAERDCSLVSAASAAVDRVEHFLSIDDGMMADVTGAIVRRLLAHPSASDYRHDLAWCRVLARWDKLRQRVGSPPMMLADLIDHHAGVLLCEARQRADRDVRAIGGSK